MSDPRPLRVGTHQPTNIYYADIPPGVRSDEGQIGYIRVPEISVVMVDAYNARLVCDRGLVLALHTEADRVEALGGDYNTAVAVGIRAAARMVEHPETISGGTDA